jgi:hypothetical protein
LRGDIFFPFFEEDFVGLDKKIAFFLWKDSQMDILQNAFSAFATMLPTDLNKHIKYITTDIHNFKRVRFYIYGCLQLSLKF